MFFVFENVHQTLATPRVTTDSVDSDSCTFLQDTCVDKRAGQADESRRIAPRIGNSLGFFKLCSLFLGEFYENKPSGQEIQAKSKTRKLFERTGKSIVPILVNTKGGRRINNYRPIVVWFNPRGSFLGSGIRKTYLRRKRNKI